jgi:hypothetical protein
MVRAIFCLMLCASIVWGQEIIVSPMAVARAAAVVPTMTEVRDTIDANNRDGYSKGTPSNTEYLSYNDFAFSYAGIGGTDGVEWTGYQFSLSIPKSATIDTAIITLNLTNKYGTWTAGDSLVWMSYASDNIAVFGNGDAHNLPSHATTTGYRVIWQFTPEIGAFATPNIASLLQPIVNRSGWSSGSYAGFILGPSTTLVSGHEIETCDFAGLVSAEARIRVVYH